MSQIEDKDLLGSITEDNPSFVNSAHSHQHLSMHSPPRAKNTSYKKSQRKSPRQVRAPNDILTSTAANTPYFVTNEEKKSLHSRQASEQIHDRHITSNKSSTIKIDRSYHDSTKYAAIDTVFTEGLESGKSQI